MAIHSSTFAWRIPWTVCRVSESDTTEVAKKQQQQHIFTCIISFYIMYNILFQILFPYRLLQNIEYSAIQWVFIGYLLYIR